ncbi:DUF4158 domain-containing protein [Spirillospora sp. CA-142024]|uniref:DUF4158 domain-containing protein n=1 Tax=Spirillospora sp. CA-142024 TaxID=3240036 RepID=UPI003D8E48A9
MSFALMLRFYTRHGRFPRGRAEFADEVVGYVARQVKVPASELGLYDWTGRTIEYHRAQIRDHLGFRVCGVVDAEKLTQWLAAEVAHAEPHPDRVREELLRHCREERIEPPTPDRVTRMVRSALHVAEEVPGRLPPITGPGISRPHRAGVWPDWVLVRGQGVRAGGQEECRSSGASPGSAGTGPRQLSKPDPPKTGPRTQRVPGSRLLIQGHPNTNVCRGPDY